MAATAAVLLTLLLGAAAEEKNPFLEAARTLLQEQMQGGGFLHGLMQGGGGAGGGKPDILSGLGSLLQGQQEAGGAPGGIDPQLVGHFVSLFAGGQDGGENNNVDENNNDAGGVDWEGIVGLASSFLGQKQGGGGGGGGGGMEGLLNLLPILLQSSSSSSSSSQRQQPARRSAPAGLPFLGTLLEYWDHFRGSELGRTLWRSSGLEATARLFTDERGNFQADKIFSSLENHSFRRRWIKGLTSFVASWAAYMAQPETQARYLGTFQMMANNFLKAQGYHKGALFDPARPADSLSHLANAVFKRQFGLKVNSATYIKPAVAYVQDVFRLGQSKGVGLSHLTPQEMESRMADALNGEVIEPVLRVWRAYRFSLRQPRCDRYVICTINSAAGAGEGIKPGVTKLSSLVASWFLSGQTGTPFWKLYNAATEGHNCQVQYPVDCDEFHAEDIRATTEYAHSEL
ncbi:uncharacterized protein LOC134536856 [Bacillus rossius redtenbacheri]|uniref:uncharacterized protein LOC134536856 n=1 Tax=Bacillus rossius redtenbacheri TaxID=93214 RepID=UPI002FDD919E